VPLIEIRALPQPPDVDVQAVMAAVAEAVRELLQNRPQGTWVTWDTIERYTEGPNAATEQPRSTHPPIVTVSAAAGRPKETLLKVVSETLERKLGLDPDSVWIQYVEVG
jgi:phenylpyruvate tautomerase PptA (4-oxalocrotonate tautomerase family)